MDMFGSHQIALQFGLSGLLSLLMSSCPSCSDFLRYHHLLIGLASSRLLDASTLKPIPTVSSVPVRKPSELYAELLSTSEEFRDLLAEYPDVNLCLRF